jgi:valyl-tRNA synthetase|tara:strand:- start:43 stop:462 length:420 start_codon:yes stop_codon:yes gene_type:complete
LRDVLELLMPFIPHLAEELYHELSLGGADSQQSASWPQVQLCLVSPQAEERGRLLCALLSAVRRFKSEAGLSLGAELARIQIVDGGQLLGAEVDIVSSMRAREIEWVNELDTHLHPLALEEGLELRAAVAVVESGAPMV